METAVLALHFIVCLFLICVILLQAGKGADIGAAFGAGGSQTVFGPRGAATFLTKVTTVVAILFIVTSISLARFASKAREGSRSVIETAAPVPITQPVTPQDPKVP